MMFCLEVLGWFLLETTHFCPGHLYSASECIEFRAVQLHNSIMEDRNVQEKGVALENLSFCNEALMRHNNMVHCCHITGPVLHVPLWRRRGGLSRTLNKTKIPESTKLLCLRARKLTMRWPLVLFDFPNRHRNVYFCIWSKNKGAPGHMCHFLRWFFYTNK